MTLRSRFSPVASGIAAALFLLVHPGLAEMFTIDQSRSQLTLSGRIVAPAYGISSPITQQGAGSLTTSYTGTVNVAQSASTLTFSGLSYIDARTNGVWQPGIGAVSGSAPADYGGHIQSGPFISANVALRNMVLDITSLELPLANGQFDAAQLTLSFVPGSNGTVDYLSNLGIFGTVVLAGSTTNAATTPGTLSLNNNFQELIIPVDATYLVVGGDVDGTTFRLAGQLTATAPLSLPPRIELLTVQNGTALLSVTNASPAAVLLTSTNLLDWVDAGTSVSNSAGLSFFAVPASQPRTFYRVKN